MWVVRTLLERGFAVRGTVRAEDKGKFMIEYFKSLGYGDKFEVVVVDDIVKVSKCWAFRLYLWPNLGFKEGAFDEAVKGVDAIAHTASPYHFRPEGAQGPISLWNSESSLFRDMYSTFYEVDLIKPAVQGTLGMLKSALKNGYDFAT